MPSSKSNEDKQALAIPDTISLSTEERVELLARLIAERIAEDEANGFALLEQLRDHYERQAT